MQIGYKKFEPHPFCTYFFTFCNKAGNKQCKYNLLPTYKVKFMYSEKVTKFCEISTVDLSYVVPVKSTVVISQNFVAFSEYMNFNK